MSKDASPWASRLRPSRRLVIAQGAGFATLLPPLSALPQQAAPSPQPASAATARELVAAPARARLRPAPAPETEIWAFDGAAPGPVLRMRQGETLRLALQNRTDKPLSLHWHGVRNDHVMDGVGGFSQEPVPPGGQFEYRLTPPDAGTFLYRPMLLGGSSEPAGRGLSGLMIVDEKEPPTVDLDLPVLIGDWLLGDDQKLLPFAADGQDGAAAGRLGSWLTVNGKAPPLPIRLAPGSRVRLRLANACNARIMRLRFDEMKAFVAAVDGQPTDTFEPVRAQLPFAPGTRYDVIFDMPEAAGAAASVTALIGPGVPLVRFVGEGAAKPARAPVAPMALNPALPAAVRLQDARRAEFVIEGGAAVTPDNKLDLAGLDLARPWTVNGGRGDPKGKPLFSVRRGSPVVIGITNRTAFLQPLHVHGHAFRLLHPLDDGWEPYFLDTVQIPEGKRLHIAFIADNPGRWPISSTVLERFDRGLWSWFEVT
ncbi:multicopper oxidase family protein [Bosea sp. CS1GBMeth4]|uniref:multicopper oxidase family protein n=1 Tax=Bosea sp. CS1GBMeth4 TaxID=1892849 RepID=UPI001646B9A0|nr:multicopper oxidase family protein [Bosea sp. CS1GBMeth4]